MNIIIRKAEERDIKDIQQLSQELIEYEKGICKNDYMVDLEWSLSDNGRINFEDFIKNHHIFVACINDKIVGYMCGWILKQEPWDNSRVAEIVNLCTSKEYRNMGIGKKLIDTFKKVCVENNIRYFKLHTLSDNENAINFYKKMGLYNYGNLMMFDFEKEYPCDNN